MPPRFAYWTIIAGNLPTAFRATRRDELAPTFQRLKERHPDAVMKWFARGQLWDSPEVAREELLSRRKAAEQARPSRSGPRRERAAVTESRHRDWRPGGDHRDPRQQYKETKRQRNIERRRTRFARRHDGTPTTDRPARPRGALNVPGEPEPRRRSSQTGGGHESRQRPRTQDAERPARNSAAPSPPPPRRGALRPKSRFRR
jgi:hypothetical protein